MRKENEVVLNRLDTAVQEVGMALAGAFPSEPWKSIRYAARWTPTGDVGADDFWLVGDSGVEQKVLPEISASLHVSDAAKHHWQLTQELGQPRWYKVIVTVERSGKFAVEFEYKDDYQEGDIMLD